MKLIKSPELPILALAVFISATFSAKAQIPKPSPADATSAATASETPAAYDPAVDQLLRDSYKKLAGIVTYPCAWEIKHAAGIINDIARRHEMTLSNPPVGSFSKSYYKSQIEQAQQEVRRASSLLRESGRRWEARQLDFADRKLSAVLAYQ